MAKAMITIICATCGQEFRHTRTCYNRDDATRYEEWARDNIATCPACYGKAQRAKERAKLDAQTAEARKAIEGMELSELIGTEKQIKWASDIRARAAAILKPCGGNAKFWEKFNAITDAKWWIENRDHMSMGPRTIARYIITWIPERSPDTPC